MQVDSLGCEDIMIASFCASSLFSAAGNLLDKPCKLPVVIVDVDKLLLAMSRRPACSSGDITGISFFTV